jgi:hypothetical protein
MNLSKGLLFGKFGHDFIKIRPRRTTSGDALCGFGVTQNNCVLAVLLVHLVHGEDILQIQRF